MNRKAAVGALITGASYFLLYGGLVYEDPAVEGLRIPQEEAARPTTDTGEQRAEGEANGAAETIPTGDSGAIPRNTQPTAGDKRAEVSEPSREVEASQGMGEPAETVTEEVLSPGLRPGVDNRPSRGSNRHRAGTFILTAYAAGYNDTGKRPQDDGYGITASGSHVQEGRTIAADWRVLPRGTRVYIEGLGEYVVEDKGGAIKGNRIDVFIADEAAVKRFGRQTREVWIID